MTDISYPLQHVSVRVPWHDNGWNGTICNYPKLNTACLKLKGIGESKNEEDEEIYCGTCIKDLIDGDAVERIPPCVKERATFMADFEFFRQVEHPYSRNGSKTHGHFRPTSLRYPAYSAAAVPFRWMMKETVFGDGKKSSGAIDRYPMSGADLAHEPDLGFESIWMQDHRNQSATLSCFWKHVEPKDSLVFFYAKQVPLVEDIGRRVLVGVGRVKHIGKLTEYSYEGRPGDKLRSMLWETMLVHTIRPGFEDGFLLPYHEALEKCDEGRAFDPAEVVAFAPDDRFQEFSYATEHVSSDAAISALLAIRAALQKCAETFFYESAPYEKWIDRELGRLWKKRGPFPGLGAVLSALGVTMGNFVAQSLVQRVGEHGDPWTSWFEALEDPDAVLPAELAQHIDDTIADSWRIMGTERFAFLKLLSRMDITQDQAMAIVSPEARLQSGIAATDIELITNPYLLYEATRLTSVPVSVGVVDRGMFPPAIVRDKFPLPAPSLVKTAVDKRRLRALTIRSLEEAAVAGDTLRPREDVIRDLRQLAEEDEQKAQIAGDLLAVAEAQVFEGEIRIGKMEDGSLAYQLERLALVGDLIRKTVEKRVGATRHALDINWRKELDAFLLRNGFKPSKDPVEQAQEGAARVEKTAALEELAASRFSVLIGSAGTGKTTLLSVLCAQPDINRNGVLLLAPTGKARVRMEDVAQRAGIDNCRAYTLAQHLSASGRYDVSIQHYRLTGDRGEQVGKTVIVDECSMLTEEMMAALIESLAKVDRLIFVGDYRQLPPIGAGRPFVDIVTKLKPENAIGGGPNVAPGYAELVIPRRQTVSERDDLLLASWFGGGEIGPGDDQVFDILSGKRKSDTIEFHSWETPDELEKLLPEVLSQTLGFDPEMEEWKAFGLSLGGNEWEGSVWYNGQYKDKPGSGIAAEDWQILSPVRQKPWGVDGLNRYIHGRYKGKQIEIAQKVTGYRSIPKPRGEQQIIYGDKIINNRNMRIWGKRMYPPDKESGYLANGEIGMVIGHRKTKKRNWTPQNLEVEFSTQRGKTFTFYGSDFKEEGEASLELAYALTVHKAQGSEFNIVFLVLPRSPLMVTRELLYTALTRQRRKVVVLLQGSATDLHRYSSERYSATACRLTNLFLPPKRVAVNVESKSIFLEDRLIHHTARGDLVRSKSEVIIANLLHAKNVDYAYENELVLDGTPRNKFPDFTIEDDDTGKTYYWEHLGMLSVPGYKLRWQEKEAWYRDHGILPYKKGGGPNGTLITTHDEPNGGIDSAHISQFIDEAFGV